MWLVYWVYAAWPVYGLAPAATIALVPAYRGDRPTYWTKLVLGTYDQEKALSGFFTRTYVLSKFSTASA